MTKKEARKELYSYLHSKRLEDKKLDQPVRNILELRFVKGMKIEEISVELDRE